MLGFITWYCSKVSSGVVALADDVAAVEDRDQRRVIHAAVQLGHELAGLADEVGFDFQAEGEVAAVAASRRSARAGRRPAARTPTGRRPWGDRTRSRG